MTKKIEILIAAFSSSAVPFTALFGLKDETISLVAIYAAKALGSIAIVLENSPLEYIIIGRVVRLCPVGRIDAEKLCQTIDKELGIGEFAAARFALIGDELFNLLFGGSHQVLVVKR